MLKRTLTPFGLSVKTKLLEMGQPQEWLIRECRSRTGMYMDSSTMYKLLTGQLNSLRLRAAVCEILHLPDDTSRERHIKRGRMSDKV